MADTEKKPTTSVAKYYYVSMIWLGYSILFGLSSAFSFLVVIALSVAVLLLCGRGEGKNEQEDTVGKKPEPETTGNPDLDKMIGDGAKAISEMRRLNDNIADEKISADIERLEKSSRAIFEQVKEEPEKLPQIRKFMDYYLPTTLKILNAYDRMSETGISGENIDTTKERVESMMTTIVTAFEKQYDSLFGADALDISTDITVLETLMAQEGFIDTPREEKPQNPGETNIQLKI